MPVSPRPSNEDLKLARLRTQEWREFRIRFLYSQRHLADTLGCARRTVCAIESGRESIHPNVTILRRFRELKRKQERIYGPPTFTNIDHLFTQQQRRA